MKLKSQIAILFLLVVFSSLSAKEKMFFEHFTQSQGLPSNNINYITQDSDGLLWFATYNGLASYNGYDFTTYRYSPADSSSINHDLILCITEQSSRYLWIGTYRGFCRFDKEQNNFTRFTDEKYSWLTTSPIRKIVFDSTGNAWFASNASIAKYSIKNDSVVIYENNPDDTTTVCSNAILDLLIDKNNNIWLATRNGLDLYNPQTGKIRHLIKDQEFQRIVEYEDGILAITRFFDRYFTPSVDNIDLNIDLNKFPKTDFIFTDVLVDYLGCNWYTIREHGLFQFNSNNTFVKRYKHNKYSKTGINSNVPQCIYKDRDNNLWIGTHDGGINFHSPYRKSFNNVQDNFRETGLQNNKVKVIYEDRDGDIWIGTKVGGMLSKFDKETETFTHYRHNPNDPTSLSDEYIFSITDAKPGYLWVGTMMGGLNLFNKQTGECTVFKHDENDPKSLTGVNIRALLVDGDKLWVSLHRLGVDLFDVNKKEKIANFQASDNEQDLSSNAVNVIYKDSYQNIWLGTYRGLNCYDRQNNTFIRFMQDENDSNSISDNMVFGIVEDKDHFLWIGTKNGLNRFDPQTKKFKVFNTNTGLATNSIYGLAIDDSGQLWMSTNIGICKFNYKTNESHLYTVEDGISNNEFVPSVFAATRDGDVFFGGNEGFTYFNPDDIIDNPKKPAIVFTDFKVFNESVKPGGVDGILAKHITSAETINLTYKHSVFSIEYTALNFNSPGKNQYKYKMEGFDKDWNNGYTNRTATYTNLSPGKYIFKVLASNNDGIWTDEPKSLEINITPPWWKMIGFRVFFIAIVVFIVVFFYWISQRIFKKQNKLLEHKVMERTVCLDKANRELLEQKEKLGILNMYGQGLINLLKKDQIYKMIYNYVTTLLDASVFAIGIYDEKKDSIVFSAFIEEGKPQKKVSLSIHDKKSCAVWCYNNQQVVFLNDFKNDYKKYIDEIEIRSTKMTGSAIYLTLTVKEKRIGVITVQSYLPDAYTKNDLDTLQTLTSYLAIALDNANAHYIVNKQKIELEQQHVILEEQVKERTKDLEEAKSMAEESDRLKSSFLANMSHEIRTPLNAIVGFSKIMALREHPPEKRQRFASIIEQSSRSLLQIINDIIDISKIEAGQMSVSQYEVEIDQILSELYHTYKLQIGKTEKRDLVKLKVGKKPPKLNPVLLTDQIRLKQIFTNLINNALKFTEEGFVEFGYKDYKDGFGFSLNLRCI